MWLSCWFFISCMCFAWCSCISFILRSCCRCSRFTCSITYCSKSEASFVTCCWGSFRGDSESDLLPVRIKCRDRFDMIFLVATLGNSRLLATTGVLKEDSFFFGGIFLASCWRIFLSSCECLVWSLIYFYWYSFCRARRSIALMEAR